MSRHVQQSILVACPARIGRCAQLRSTEVYGKDGSEWQLAHRRADPLVHRITLQQAAALARGRSENE
jgi:hypothetical protein